MRITVSIPENLAMDAQKAARNEKVSVSGLTAKALEHYLVVLKRRKMGERVLDLVGKVRVSEDAADWIEKERIDERT